MPCHPLLKLVPLFLAGCAGAGAIYEFRPTEGPLLYHITDHGQLLIDTPVGEQRSTDSTQATVAIEIGKGDAEGREVSVTFEALQLWAGGDFPARHTEGGELIGRPFRGTLSRTGSIKVTAGPDISKELSAVTDPSALFTELLAPLPPGGESEADAWPHRTSFSTQAAMSMQASYDGTASFAGDTTWNGQAARIIVSEGITTATAHGTPAGAPGEVEFTYTGRSTTRYIWDPERGVMLASSASIKAKGELEVRSMQMKMPITYEGSRQVALLKQTEAQ
ncbi:MAG: hypothetical protein V3U13_04795 [Gemmatimonadota bacterium]